MEEIMRYYAILAVLIALFGLSEFKIAYTPVTATIVSTSQDKVSLMGGAAGATFGGMIGAAASSDALRECAITARAEGYVLTIYRPEGPVCARPTGAEIGIFKETISLRFPPMKI